MTSVELLLRRHQWPLSRRSGEGPIEMISNNIVGLISKREWAAWGILVACFVALIAFQQSVWLFVAAVVLFVAYVSWTTSAYFVAQGTMGKRAVAALALPVCLAIFKAAICFGVAWLVRWLARRLFGI
jgi:hypothetical protein